ncbi:MAG: transglycosylase domain-containing protein, partial [Bdellovibrionota bacterium]
RLLTRENLRRLATWMLGLGLVALIALVVWLFQLDRDIRTRLAEKRFAPPVEFYSSPEFVRPGATYPPNYFEDLFTRKAYARRSFTQSMAPGDISVWTGDECRGFLGLAEAAPDPALDQALATSTPDPGATPLPTLSPSSIAKCIAFVNRGRAAHPGEPAPPEPKGQVIAIGATGLVIGTYDREQKRGLDEAIIEAELFAQYYGDKPVLRNIVTIASGEVPPLCLNALIAAEDEKFYEHAGFSPKAIARIIWVKMRGLQAQGGSTITQQLVKNYFLTAERTIKRKVIEIAMAVLLEQNMSKDDILETYINLIYMGQNGPFEVRGFAAAAQHYFGKPLRDLELQDCAMLVGILNNPGRFDPAFHADRALEKRGRVLQRMVELKYIDEAKAKEMQTLPLPTHRQRALTEPAPYFVQAVRRDLQTRGISFEDGLRVFTTLNLRAQEAAHQAVRTGLDRLETTNATVKKIKEKGKSLEAVLISSDPRTGAVEALVGGRGFIATQFNRAMDSRRQVGSVMKPFVFLTAFETQTPEGQPYQPLTRVSDNATTHKFEGQTWTPKNYDGKYNGDVPLYYALKESLNAATVNLGMAVGLDNVLDTAKRMGVTSKIKALPSLTLGAFEMSPFEVLQAYGAISTFGRKVPLTLVHRIEDLAGQELYVFAPEIEQAASSDSVAELVGAMKQTTQTGTARVSRLLGFTHPSAGKTGTTNDQKDAWFAGFTPYHTAIVWVGYDDNTSHKLTGASGAVPIWTQYMKAYASSFPADDFVWPEGTDKQTYSQDELMAFGVPEAEFADPKNPSAPIELIFREGLAPSR